MKRKFILVIILFAAIVAKSQTILLQETFQDWTAQDTAISYSVTKKLFDGKTVGMFTSNALIVEPAKNIGKSGKADGNGNPTNGRIAIKGAKSFLELPELPSIGQVNIKASSGKDLREFKLQIYKNGDFVDISGTVTPCSNTVTKLYTFNFSYTTPTTIRIVPTSGSRIYIYDLEVYSIGETKRK